MCNHLTLDKVSLFRDNDKLFTIDTDIAAGDILTVMGASGAGKSTLLNWVVGQLEQPFHATGNLFLGKDNITLLPTHQRHVGILYQDALLFEHLTVAQNIMFGMPKGDNRHEKATKLLIDIGLEGMEKRSVETLSGGQKARVALLRVIASMPKAILLDEPFSKLDAELRTSTRQWVFDLIKQHQLPTILVTHDPDDAAAANGKILEI